MAFIATKKNAAGKVPRPTFEAIELAVQGVPEGFLGHFRDVVRLPQIAAQGLPACNFDLL